MRTLRILFTLWIAAAILGRAASASMAATHYALLIGSGDFPESSRYSKFSLEGPKSDVQTMATLLMWRFHFRPENITVVGLSNAQQAEITQGRAGKLCNGGVHATYAAIKAGFEWLKAMVHDPQDTVVVYYAGHGLRVYNPDPNAPDVNSNALVPYDTDGLGNILVRDYELRAWLTPIASKRKTLIIDSCFSGGVLHLRDANDPEGILGRLVSRDLPPLSKPESSGKGDGSQVLLEATIPPDTVLLAGCRPEEHAFEQELLGNPKQKLSTIWAGEFTWALYYVLCHTQTDVTLEKLRDLIAARLKQRGRTQMVVIGGHNASPAAIASVRWASDAVRMPVICEEGANCTLDLGWLAGLRLHSVLTLQPANAPTSTAHLESLGWFRSQVRAPNSAKNGYITVKCFP